MIRTITSDGSTYANVADTVPGIPAVLVPTKDAILIPKGPGVISEIEIISVNSVLVSHP